MLSRLQEFVSRHRRKFIITGLVVGGTMVALKYAQRKLTELQERQAREFFERTRRMHHFESTEKTCNQVIFGMGDEMCQAVLRECNTDDILEQLRQNPPNKVALWEELKIVAFTRLTALVYAASMLTIALRVQLNLLGGYIYRDITVNEGANGVEKVQITDDLKQQYLSLIRHFITDDGIRDLVRYIRSQVVAVLESMPLSRQLTIADTEQVFWSLQMAINADRKHDPIAKMTKYLLPALARVQQNFSTAPPLLLQMYNETLDLLDNEDTVGVCAHNVSRGFVLACDAIAESISDTTSSSSTSNNNNNDLVNINNVLIALAKLLPIISGLTARGYDSASRPHNLATQLLTFYVVAEKSKTLGANVYETFSSG